MKNNIKKYTLDQSPFYLLSSKKKLAKILLIKYTQLKEYASDCGNYQTFLIPKSICEITGKITKERYVQNPSITLKSIHKRIQTLLSRVESPDYNHGASLGKSYHSNAKFHQDSECVATFDIKSFFENTSRLKVFNFFLKKLKCSSDISDILSRICTYQDKLATGSPLSPILSLWANLDLFNTINQRMTELNLKFSLYIDDITISGEKIPTSINEQIKGIITSYGFRLSENKTRFFSKNQPKHITGLITFNGSVRVPNSRFKKK